MIVLGVDPGSRTGLSVCVDRSVVECATVGIDQAEDHMRILARKYMVDRIAIETPGAHIHARKGLSAGAMMKIARSVGQLEERTRQLAKVAESELGEGKVRLCQPVKGGTKRAMPANVWKATYNWTGRMPSNHARDAAMLAHRICCEERLYGSR